MKLNEVMANLEAAGTEQNRKIYGRHGASAPIFGVSYGHLNKLARSIKVDHELAADLFAIGNHDARELAVKVVDPARITVALANDWAKAVDCYPTAGGVAGAVARSSHARSRSDLWRDQKREWPASIDWLLVAFTAEDPNVFTVEELDRLLHQIEAEIHERPNRVRHEMNQAVIAIALRSPKLQRRAIATARRIGAVQVDHGVTGCVTPDAVGYIEKTVAYRASR